MSFKPPRLCLHRATGRAYVKHRGRRIYFGKYVDPESRERYERFVAEQRRLADGTGKWNTTVARLCVEFLKHAESHYVDAAGKQTAEVTCYRQAIRPLVKLFGRQPASEFGPKKLLEVRKLLIARHVRKVVNRQVSRVRHVFKWGVSNELVPVSVYNALQCVSGLQKGRSPARESEPVRPVTPEAIEQTLPHLPETVRAMVQVQVLTGARPSEVRELKIGEIDRSGAVWKFTPSQHKNAWRGKERVVFAGPRAQAILMPFIADAVRNDRYVFPAGSHDDESNQPYDLASYRRAVTRACEVAFGMPAELRDITGHLARQKHLTAEEGDAEKIRLREQAALWRKKYCWSPNQLRHTAATLIRSQFGDLDAARVVLGHSERTTTQIYAERDLERAARIAAEIG